MKNQLLKKLILPVFILLGSFIYAQTVTGVVSDASGPVPGANVLIKGTTTGTVTDFDGNFEIAANNGDVLVFSFIGYLTQEITYTGQAAINVLLEEDAAQLDEVVVIGYGTTTVKDATGSVSSVRSEDFNRGVIASPEQLIQGKTAGVQISQSTGEPGGGIAIRIRGTGSVRSNNNPLFVVDGVPLAGDDTSASGQDIGFGSKGASNPLSFLNPNDIQSISVLKDASSTAIYGSRGANGVVIITTKSGKGSPGELWEYGVTISSAKAAEEYDLLGRDAFLGAITQFGGNAGDQDSGSNTNWQNVVTRRSLSVNQNLTYSRNYTGGSVRGTFSYGEDHGVLEKSALEKITARINAYHRFFDNKLTVALQSTYSRVNDEQPGLGAAGFQGDLLGAAYSANPTWPNDPNFDAGGQRNPANFLEYVGGLNNTDRILLNLSAEYNFTPELSGKVNLGYDKSNSDKSVSANALARNMGDSTFGNGDAAFNEVDVENNLLELTFTYKKDFPNSNLTALVGYSFQDFNRSGRNIRGNGFGTTDLVQMGKDLENSANIVEGTISGSYQQYGVSPAGFFINRLFPTVVTETGLAAPSGLKVRSIAVDTYDNTDELQSFFARLNYTIANKYLFTATVRADGSSRFGESNQYGYFPSGAIAWKINEEDFMGDAFSTLKLRVSGGITGNQDGLGYANFIRRERFGGIGISSNGNVNAPGLNTVAFANPDLKWEETLSYGVGLDFGFNNDRLTGSIDVYRKETTDLLLQIQAAQPSPQPTFFQNLDATLINQGVEFAINYDIAETEDFSWDASFNIAYNENELKDFGGLIPAGTIRGQGLSQAFAQILAGGHPLFSYYLREFEGFDSNGQPIGDNQTFVGKSALPDINLGFSTNLRYKNWDFSAYFAGQYGHYVYNNTRNAFFTAGAIANGRNVTPDVLTAGEAGNAEAAVSTRFLESGDFLRLQNLTIGRNFTLKDGTFKSLRLYLNGQNLFVITPYSGLDPEVSSSPANGDLLGSIPTAGIDYTAYPKPRTITLGINATF